MMSAREEIREAFRLAELHNLGILDTPEEPDFDALAQIASDLLNCPFATLTLVDSDRQWFKARVGVSVCETPRDMSICQHAVLQDQPLIIEDLLSDHRVRNSPLVTSSPYLRSYLGVPVRSINKALIGTLCVFDTMPRKWTQEDVALIARLTRIAEQLLQKYHMMRCITLPDFSGNPDLKTISAICGVWWSNANSSNVTISAGLRSLLGIPEKIQVDKVWFSKFGVRRTALLEDVSNKQESKNTLKYDFLHPSGFWLKIEETIYCSDLNQMIEYCGVVRLEETHQNKSTPQLSTSAKSRNVLEWLASNKVGFIRIDNDDLAHIFESENDNNCPESLPIPWKACFAKSDRKVIQNEITAGRLGLRTNTLFVRNASKNNSNNWLKLEFMSSSYHVQQSTGVVVEFSQMLQC